MRYIFQNYTLDIEMRELLKNDEIIRIEPQVFKLLELIVSQTGNVVTKETINEKVWNGRIVSEAAVNSRIRSARLAIGDSGKDQRLIKTVHGVGFKFVGDVEFENHDRAPQLTRTKTSEAGQHSGWRSALYALIAIMIITLVWNVTNNSPEDNGASFEAKSIAVLPFADMSDTGD